MPQGPTHAKRVSSRKASGQRSKSRKNFVKNAKFSEVGAPRSSTRPLSRISACNSVCNRLGAFCGRVIHDDGLRAPPAARLAVLQIVYFLAPRYSGNSSTSFDLPNMCPHDRFGTLSGFTLSHVDLLILIRSQIPSKLRSL